MLRTSIETEIRERIETFAHELVELVKLSTLAAVGEMLGTSTPARAPTTRRSSTPRLRTYEVIPAPAPQPRRAPASGSSATVELSLPHYERMAYQRAIAENGGDLVAAAKVLGVGKSTIYRRMQLLDIPLDEVPPPDSFLVTGEPVSLAGYERMAVERALAETGGDRLAASKLLGVGKSTLYRMVAKHGLG